MVAQAEQGHRGEPSLVTPSIIYYVIFCCEVDKCPVWTSNVLPASCERNYATRRYTRGLTVPWCRTGHIRAHPRPRLCSIFLFVFKFPLLRIAKLYTTNLGALQATTLLVTVLTVLIYCVNARHRLACNLESYEKMPARNCAGVLLGQKKLHSIDTYTLLLRACVHIRSEKPDNAPAPS